MQTKEIPSFLQISINTDKFSHFTSTLNSILSAHDKILQEHTRQLSQIRYAVQDKLSRIRKEMDYEGEKYQKKRKEDHQYFNTFLNDWTIKNERFADEWRGRIDNFEEEHVAIKKQLNITGGKVGEEVQQLSKKQMETMIDQCRKQLENEVATVAAKVLETEEKMKSSIATNDYLVRNIFEAYESRNPIEPIGKEVESTPSTVVNHRKTMKEPTKIVSGGISIEEITIKQGRDKKKKKLQSRYQQQNLQYASVSAKLDSIQTRLNAKQNPILNKIAWSGHKPQIMTAQSSQNNISLSMNKIEAQRKNLEQGITFKLEHIEQIIQQKFSKIEKDMSRITTIQDLLTDKIEIATRKVEKDRSKLTDVCLQIKRFEDKKFDQKMIENVMAMIKRQSRNLEEEVEKKVGQQNFDKEKQRVNQKLHIVSETLGDKADKEEIKRAFQFVQDKIKQIVMIIAEDIQQEKEGAIRRMPFKCLSCDKDLEFTQAFTHRIDKIEGERKALPRGSTSSTSQMRKRIRILNNDDK